MEKLFVVRVCRRNSRRLLVFLGLALFLLLPCVLHAQGISDLKQRAEKGDAVAQGDLGLAYEIGKGGLQDYPKAEWRYRKLAESGDSRGQRTETSQFNTGGYTAANFDLNNLSKVWNRTMEAFHRDYFSVPTVGLHGETEGYWWILARGEESRARKDGVYMAINANDPEYQRRVSLAVASMLPPQSEFASSAEYEKVFVRAATVFDHMWTARCKKEESQLIADQRAMFKPYVEGQWPVPGIIRLYCESEQKIYEVQVDIYNSGYVMPIVGIKDSEYYLIGQLSVVRDALRKLESRPENIVVISCQLPNLTVLAADKSGVYRDVTRTGEIGNEIQKTLKHHLEQMNVCEPRTYTLKTPDDFTVYRNGMPVNGQVKRDQCRPTKRGPPG